MKTFFKHNVDSVLFISDLFLARELKGWSAIFL